MTAEQRIQALIGQLHFSIAMLQADLETAQNRIAELEKEKAPTDQTKSG